MLSTAKNFAFTLILNLVLACFCFVVGPLQATAQDKGTIDFSRDIKPILSDRCFQCHGPDENQRLADLRLDVSDAALESAIVAGDSDESEIIRRILSDDPDEVMPPPEANKKKLTASEVSMLKTWIDQGAKYQSHWSYEKPTRPKPPELEELSNWAKNDIDKFIAKRLEEAKKTPSNPADKRTLIRRVYFDLIGLPPSPAKVKQFVADSNPNAFEKIVDELLHSESFGERMAVYWLDQVRYADTNGMHGDNHRDHSLFRDYVIEAFNDNMPFDQFTVEQLAGDLLPNRTNKQLIASGYNRLNMTTREGGAQAKEYRAKYASDRVRNASVVWMGSTLGCAECHDHKYDPFKAKDFYRFAAFFSDIDEVAVGQQKPTKLPSESQEKQLAEINFRLEEATNNFNKRTPAREKLFEEFLASSKEEVKTLKPAWVAVSPITAESSGGATLQIGANFVKSTGKNPDKDVYTISLDPNQKTVTGFKVDLLTDPEFGNQSLSRGNGNVVLTNVTATHDGKPVKIKTAFADFSQPNHDVKLAIDNRPETGWAPSGHTKKENRKLVFVFEKPLAVVSKKPIVIKLHHESVYGKHNIGKFQISLTDVSNPTLDGTSKFSGKVIALLQKEVSELNEADKNELYRFFLRSSDSVKTERELVNQLKKQKSNIENSFRPILVTNRIQPRMTRVLPRGDWLNDSGEVVTPGVPSFLPQISTEKDAVANRLDLAEWIISPENPLTARVFVNRLWKIAFGEGIVRTPDDFGSQGSFATHPELLDYLASKFVDSGWDTKKLVKSIVMTNAYRQSSNASLETLKTDPANELLSRQNRFRIDAEFVRDNALFVSGLLVDKVGGDSVKPYQPPGYWEHLNFPKRKYQSNQDENQYRRGLYAYWCRTFLNPSMSVFDAPSREEACVQRSRSNTPLQALVLLNDPTYVEAAQAFAEKILRTDGDLEARLNYAFDTVLNRTASKLETQLLVQLFQNHKSEFSNDLEASKASTKIGLRNVPDDLDPTELAAWTSVARTILNLHETITRY